MVAIVTPIGVLFGLRLLDPPTTTNWLDWSGRLIAQPKVRAQFRHISGGPPGG